MNSPGLNREFSTLSTALIVDACLRLQVKPRLAPPGIHPVVPGIQVAGSVLPVRHYGSVDIFLEVMRNADPGDVLVIDNQNLKDEACIGDLTVLEAKAHGIGGILVWGCHRDTSQLMQLGFPVFSYGVYPMGPRRSDTREPEALTSVFFGDFKVFKEDVVFADIDGAVFVASDQAERVISTAIKINEKERRQAESIARGETLCQQFKFDLFLEKRLQNPGYTLGQHIKELGGAIGERGE